MLSNQPEFVPAWLLLAELSDTPNEKSACNQRVSEFIKVSDSAKKFSDLQDINIESKQPHSDNIPDLFDHEDNALHLDNQQYEEEINYEDSEYHSGVCDDTLTVDNLLTSYVINELGSHVAEDNIIHEVSLRGQLNWYDAEQLVNEIRNRHALQIAKRRSPLLLFIAVPTIISGIVWFTFSVVYVIANINYSSSLNLIAILLQSLRNIAGSIAMLLGGSVGIYRVLKSLNKI